MLPLRMLRFRLAWHPLATSDVLKLHLQRFVHHPERVEPRNTWKVDVVRLTGNKLTSDQSMKSIRVRLDYIDWHQKRVTH